MKWLNSKKYKTKKVDDMEAHNCICYVTVAVSVTVMLLIYLNLFNTSIHVT